MAGSGQLRAALLALTLAVGGSAAAGTLVSVRTSHGEALRVVVDVAGVPVEALRQLAATGRVSELLPLRLRIPAAGDTAALPARLDQLALTWQAIDGATELTIAHPEAGYRVFALDAPPRIVIDLWHPPVPAVVETWAPGVRYRRYDGWPGGAGLSVVHAVTIDAVGEWRVLGTPGERRTTSAWAGDALVAINGGYFEVASGEPIGWLVQEGIWLGEPSRGRAAIAFGPDGVAIDRVQQSIGVSVDGVTAIDRGHAWARELNLYACSGASAGSPRMGALSLDASGVVTDNRAGPLVVPEGGAVLAYPPQARALALLEPGAVVVARRDLGDPRLTAATFAVEGGPLLVQGGAPDFDPQREAFARGVRILDEATGQAAIGVMAAGGILLVVAERMIAQELVAVMLALGARDAMRLDSGSSATLVHRGSSVNRAFERPVANAIAFFPVGAP